MNQKYNDQFLLSELKRFERENKRSPMAKDFKGNPDWPDPLTFIRYFGGWSRAIEAAGLKPNFAPYTRKKYLTVEERFALHYEVA
ncbi:MAG: hypothetical protein H0X25_13800, partial [Acidobacteriales bacterium]|nr:hypothetical protein [Terriglobales bacterium]